MNQMNEKEMLHELRVDISMYNAAGAFYPSAYQKLAVNMIEEHLDTLGIGQKKLMEEKEISWVLLCQSLELCRPFSPGETLYAKTWNSGAKPPYFRRDFVFLTDGGETVAKGATVSTLLVPATRRLCTDREKLASLYLPEGEQLISVSHRFTEHPEYDEVETVHIRPSMTDGVGHVNNTRYGDFVYDALTPDERAAMSHLTRMDIWFISELREGDDVTLSRAVGSGGVTCRGRVVGNDRDAFVMKLVFGE